MTSRRFFSFFWILVLFLTQSSIGYAFQVMMPPLVLIGVIFYALTEGIVFGSMIGCFAGFLLDILGSGKLGGSMAMFSLMGAGAGFLSTKLFYDSFFTQLILPISSHYVVCIANIFFLRNLARNETADLNVLREALFLLQPWWTIFSSLVVFLLLKRVAAPRHSRFTNWKTG